MILVHPRRPFRFALGAVLALTVCPGCERDARLAGHTLRDVTVRTVTHYGITLDQDAPPPQVAYVLLRAIRDDALAADRNAREAALDKQFDVSAAGQLCVEEAAPGECRETLYKVVRSWTPTVGHYARDFETDWEQAQARFTQLGPKPLKGAGTDLMESQIIIQVEDPGGDPNARTLLVVGLIQDHGYWRVLRLGFAPGKRSLGSRGK